ncbi:MAG: ATP-dependent sacrificial sulfur transferase LarE [Candidatus Omnitrophota bacterium]
MNSLTKKYTKLKKTLKGLGSGIIAFSGGLDSGLLAKVARDCLGAEVIAVTACSPTYPAGDLRKAKIIAREIGIRHLVVKTDEFKDKNFTANSRNRCYWCKKKLFSKLRTLTSRYGSTYIMDGTNFDDRRDHRPGLIANKEYSVKSPLYECGFTKKDVRNLAKLLKLSFWNQPSQSCLSSRIPFGQAITLSRIERIGQAERILRNFFGNDILLRARDHNELVRIELEKKGWTQLVKSDINRLLKGLKKTGYTYITFDLEGYIPAGLRRQN